MTDDVKAKEKETTEESEWGFETGYDTPTEKHAREESASGSLRRFWVPVKADGDKYVCFLDDAPVRLWEHQVAINGDWKNWYTCIKGLGDSSCPLCDVANAFKRHTKWSKYGRVYIGAYSVISMTGWKDRDGKERDKNQKQLLVFKIPMMGLLKKKRDSKLVGGSLVGAVFNVYRSGDKEPNTGNDWTFEEKLSESDMKGKFGDLKVLEYRKIFRPKSRKDLLEVAQMADGVSPNWFTEEVVGTQSEVTKTEVTKTESDDDTIPF